MIQFFRSFFSSKLGVGLTLAFVGLIALAFATGDVASSGSFGGIAGGDRVATVGDQRIGAGELSRNVSSAVENMRQETPTITLKAFLAEDGLNRVLNEMIDRSALLGWAKKYGFAPSTRLVDSEIAKVPSFKGADGQFSDQLYQQAIRQRGLTDQQVREDIAQSLTARLLLAPANAAAVMPRDAVQRYAGIITERRVGQIAILPSAAFAPKTLPSDAELNAYYTKNRDDYLRPERRTVRYATFSDAVLKTVPAPTDAEIAARYNANKDKYAASEKRRITQLILPTEAAARAVLAELASGKSLEGAAAAKGLTAGSIGSLSKQQLSTQSSQAVADATFGADRGKIAGPVKSGIGWHLMRVDAIEGLRGRTLEQASGEIRTAIAAEKRRTALSDFTAKIEDEFDNGATLADVAKELGVNLTTSAPLTANGAVYGKQGETAPAVLGKVLQSAFAMEGENEPQIAEIEAGKTFIIYDVGSVVAAAPAPLAEIREVVVNDVQLSKGVVAAKAAANRVEAMVKKGSDLGAALAALGVALPPVDRIDMSREQLAQQARDRVPPPLQVLFGMATGSVKLMGAPRNRGWYVLKLNSITPGRIDPADKRLAGLRQELSRMTGGEYADQLRAAMRAELGVKRNETAISAVATQLKGSN